MGNSVSNYDTIINYVDLERLNALLVAQRRVAYPDIYYSHPAPAPAETKPFTEKPEAPF